MCSVQEVAVNCRIYNIPDSNTAIAAWWGRSLIQTITNMTVSNFGQVICYTSLHFKKCRFSEDEILRNTFGNFSEC